MMKHGGQRMATASGAILIDAALTGGVMDAAGESLFDPAYWRARAELSSAGAGRGSAWFVGEGGCWVLRHYRRGGLIARLSADRYLWTGESRVRAFAEFRLLALLGERGLPVPRPIGARYRREGWTYRCDLITRRIEGTQPLGALLAQRTLDLATWREIGATVGRLHAAGVDHADLNAHNILIGMGGVSLIDFDRGRLRAPGAWAARNLARLSRSLVKISAAWPPERFSPEAWHALLDGHASGTSS